MRRVRRANLLLHLGDLAVDVLQAEAESTAGSSSMGMDLAVAVAVTFDLLGRHDPILPTAPKELQQLPLNPLGHLPHLRQAVPETA